MPPKKRRKKKRTRKEVRYVNQQAVYIHKTVSHKKEYYFTLDKSKNNKAMHDLSGSAYKMYVYLCQNRDSTQFLISATKFCKISGLSPRSYVLAKQELVKNNYLVLREDGDYDFYNAPHDIEKEDSEPIKNAEETNC